MNFDDKIKELKIELPEAKAPVGSYVATKIVGKLLYVSGQISQNVNGLVVGKLGSDFSIEEGYEAARLCGLALIAQVKSACDGDWSRFKRVVRLGGFVNSTNTFTEHPKVINGASDLMVEVFGDKGSHARAAVGSSSLPLGVAVEVDGIFELKT